MYKEGHLFQFWEGTGKTVKMKECLSCFEGKVGANQMIKMGRGHSRAKGQM